MSTVIELPSLTIRRRVVSSMANNAYLLTCAATGEQLLIDAADDASALRELIAEGDDGRGRLAHLVTTHRHWDHVRALEEIAQATGARTYAGADDADHLPLAPDVRLAHGDTITFGQVVLDVLHLRGHTPGSIGLVHTEPDGARHLFSGDSLFPGGVGATDAYDYQDFARLIDDVEQRVFAVYDDATLVHPGHGDGTSLGAERPDLPQWRARGW